ncbi:integumentary mucin C.1-like [Sardina pilchardus]|uniref:integumentary mucin C.1-like n=1 Tax=Sardina pilchardus TaxID=27697 RepID=UPI002E104099
MDAKSLMTVIFILAEMPSAFMMSTTTSPSLKSTPTNTTTPAMLSATSTPTNTTALAVQATTVMMNMTSPLNVTMNTTELLNVTSEPSPSLTVIGLVFSTNETFTSSLLNQSSPEYQDRVNLTKQQIEPIFRIFPGFIELTVLGFRNGSIVTDSELRFDSGQSEAPDAEKVRDTFKAAVAVGNVSLHAIQESINATVIAAQATTVMMNMTSPLNVTMNTTEPLNVTSEPSPSLTVIGLVFSTNETFTSSLLNQSSPEYQDRVNLTKQQVEPIFRTVPGFIELTVLGFRNGSIVTDSELRFDSGQSEALDAEKVRDTFKAAVAMGNVSLHVIPESINATVIVPVTTSNTPSSAVTTAASGAMVATAASMAMVAATTLLLILLLEAPSS